MEMRHFKIESTPYQNGNIPYHFDKVKVWSASVKLEKSGFKHKTTVPVQTLCCPAFQLRKIII